MSFLNHYINESSKTEHGNKKVTLNKPFRTPDGPKKFAVYVKNDKGNVVKVTFGDPNMDIKRDSDDRRKSFRARHNCDNPGPKWKARYWACKTWEKGKSVSDIVESINENFDIVDDIVEETEFWTRNTEGKIILKEEAYVKGLKGKTVDQLNFIIKDANENMQKHKGTNKEDYYKDIAISAAQELLNRRKRK